MVNEEINNNDKNDNVDLEIYELEVLPGKKFIKLYGKKKWMELEQAQIVPESDVQYYRIQEIYVWNKITKKWRFLDQSKMYTADVADIERLFDN